MDRAADGNWALRGYEAVGVALAEWDRATGRYFQFSDDTAPSRAKAGDSLKP